MILAIVLLGLLSQAIGFSQKDFLDIHQAHANELADFDSSFNVEQELADSLSTDQIDNIFYDLQADLDTGDLSDQWETAKTKIKEALSHVNVYVRNAVMIVLNKFHGHVADLITKVDGVFQKFGLTSSYWQGIKESIDTILNSLKEKVDPSTGGTDTGVVDTMFDEMTEKRITKRGLGDLWRKLKAAVDDLHGKVREEVKKIIDNHPEIVEKLKKVKRVVIDGTKKVILEIHGKVVEVLSGGQIGKSD